MHEKRVYLTGSIGFKSAVIDKLGLDWIHGAEDIGLQLVCFTLPSDISADKFKELIGKELLSAHKIMFFYDMPNRMAYTSMKFLPSRPMRMSVSRNDNPDFNNRPVIYGEETKN